MNKDTVPVLPEYNKAPQTIVENNIRAATSDGRGTKLRKFFGPHSANPPCPPISMLEYATDRREDQFAAMPTLNRGCEGACIMDGPNA